ncbi:hypothetical protein Cyagr_1385 [Cyanobium gracile PCC 6307]|uniref:Uncharacterized protein n=1 Tax=Cyanobium gracile (strain ATCC 27147 / PCC 6307) TaxID=292564 RepID=K9P750_CYAGP|nr:hypothetical protein Cyagr_1385 [Cyanobium gracile PCC 6307]
MLVSTFELLFKATAPANPPLVRVPGAARGILQGYFLTIANTSTTSLTFLLTFNATTPALNLAQTVQATDVTGGNSFGDLTPTADPNRFTLSVRVPGRDTALVILQPDVTLANLPDSVEFRGFVEIEITTRTFQGQTFDVLLTPEHRGTFLPNNFSFVPPPLPVANNNGRDFDQLIVALPTATGSALFRLPSPVRDLKPLIDNTNPIPFPGRPLPSLPEVLPGPVPPGPVPPIAGAVADPELRATLARLQDGLSLMARTIDSLSGETAGADSFVSPEP